MNKKNILRSLIFIAAALIAIVFYPHRSDTMLSYHLNRPWEHQLLTAPFDIPIYPDSISKAAKIDSINKEYLPIFKENNDVITLISKDIDGLTGISSAEKNRLKQEVTKIYTTGVVDSDVLNSLKQQNISEVRFITGNTLTRRKASFLTPREVYSKLNETFGINSNIHRAISESNISGKLLPNLTPDTLATNRLYREQLQPVEAAIGVLQKGERIVDRGEKVTPQIYSILTTYEQILESRDLAEQTSDINTLAGQSLYVIILISALYFYLYIYRKKEFESPKRMLAIITSVVGIFVAAAIASRTFTTGLYIIPFAILPIMLTVFFDSRTAQFCNIIEVLLCSILAPSPLEFAVVQLLGGIAAIFSLRELTKRSQLLQTALVVFITYAIAFISFELMQTGTIDPGIWRIILYFFANAVLISFAYILIFIFEKIFGLTSMVTLVELCDINNPLLRNLSEECPGTFQHCMSVSTLASGAAQKIDANVLIVRAGALYHDIGKSVNPAFYTENQHGVNPHDALNPIQSAGIIIRHVTDGLKLASEHKLPQVLKDMICQHHGKGVTKYFYKMYEKQHPDEDIDLSLFTYPGPNPTTREASILMMADSVEAASRSMTDHSKEAIISLVNNIIDSQIVAGLHNESPISFRDIHLIKESFISRLRTMYHVRVAYPK